MHIFKDGDLVTLINVFETTPEQQALIDQRIRFTEEVRNEPSYLGLAPVSLMENLLNFDFNGLRLDTYAQPLSPQRKIDQVTVLDIAGMAVYALERPEELVGKCVELASDNISGAEIAQVLSEMISRPIHYIQVPMEQIRKRRGEEIAKMYQNFEDNPYTLDIAALHAQYPEDNGHKHLIGRSSYRGKYRRGHEARW